jgi:hypothetical protein
VTEASTAAAGRPLERSDRPWTQQLCERLPVEPAWVGAGIAALQYASCLLFLWAFTEASSADLRGSEFWRGTIASNFVMALLVGYSVAATAYSSRAQERALLELRPALRLDAAGFAGVVSRVSRFDRRRLRVVGWAAAAVMICLVIVDDTNWINMQRPSLGNPVVIWQLWANGLAAWMVLRMLAHELGTLLLLSRAGSEHAEVDLWDPRPLAPFVRRGLQSVLLWVLCFSILGLLVISGWASRAVPYMMLSLVAVASIAVLLPSYGVHRAMTAAKWARLDSLHAEIRACEHSLSEANPPEAREAMLALPGLLALRAQVQAAREWPIDVPALARFAFYLAIGLGSWLGSAVVERVLGAALE